MKTTVLDHGYVEFVEAWGHGRDGTDNRIEREHGESFVKMDEDYEVGIIEAARQSTQGSFRGWATDSKLLRFLYENNHNSPFEFAGMTLEIQAPIFVFREWHRHRTQSYNEMSARYTPLPELYYMPTADRMLRNNGTNKQANSVGDKVLDAPNASAWMRELSLFYHNAEALYQMGLKLGVPKEIARCCMPVGHYSRMRATGNLRNWLAFLTLRMDPSAQWEIRQFAYEVANVVAHKFPQTHELFIERITP